MLQLVYISTARVELPPHELEAVLAVSRRNNDRVAVTGLLVVGGRRFLQVLEGPAAAVVATFARIAADPRHFAVVELSRKPIETRQFGGWSMGYEAGAVVDRPCGLATTVARLVAPVADKNLRALFNGFGEQHARAA